ncbi:MAG: hypothetical protein LBR18_00765 [Tannerella sp.]|nr:hypothetical protein [Tannerella sp.]
MKKNFLLLRQNIIQYPAFSVQNTSFSKQIVIINHTLVAFLRHYGSSTLQHEDTTALQHEDTKARRHDVKERSNPAS